MDPNPQPQRPQTQTGAPPASHWRSDADLDEASEESFPASDPPSYTSGIEQNAQRAREAAQERARPKEMSTGGEPKSAVENPQSAQQAPMGADPPEAPKIDQTVADAYREVQPEGFKNRPTSSVEAADYDVDDTIGAE